MKGKPMVSLSLDLDNKWSYLKTHGSDAWCDYPSYLDYVVPRILDFLAQHDTKITFFVVGQDAALEKNQAPLSMLTAAGHEIASHSFQHEPWLHLYSERDLHEELEKAEQAIVAATGASVEGFRGPGFSISETTLQVLKQRGYRYDATAFPNILNPLARAYFFAKSNLSDEEKERRKGLFGSYSDAFRPVKPYRWSLGDSQLLELPVTTMPIFKVPIHFSYLIYLASFSPLLARIYMRFAMSMCRLTKTEPSLLLHPLDFLGSGDEPDLAFFPAMSMQADEKIVLMSQLFSIILKHFRPVTIGEHVTSIGERLELKSFEPRFNI